MVHRIPQEPESSGVTYASFASMPGYGGVVVDAAGVSRPLPEHESLSLAIPHWVQRADNDAYSLQLFLACATHDHPTVRAAALAAFGELARRYGRLGERAQVVSMLELGLRDRDDDVRDAATRSTMLVEELIGWHIARPAV